MHQVSSLPIRLAGQPAPAAPPGGMPFAQAMQSLMVTGDDGVAAALASPHLVQAWAHALAMYWSRIERLGGLDLSQPLYVLDLSPGDGTLAAGVLRALRAEMHACGMLGWPVRYVVCRVGAGTDEPRALLSHADLQAFAHQGWLDWGIWQASTGHPLLLGASRFPLFGSRNPVVALTAGGLGRMPAQLYGMQAGQVVQVHDVSMQSGPGDAAVSLGYAWEDLDLADVPDEGVSALLHRYCVGLASAPVLVSGASLSLLDAVADFSAGRYLLLAADYGVTTTQQLREGAMAPPEDAVPGELRLPVNFHSLALHQETAGARVASLQVDAAGPVMQVACQDASGVVDDESWQGMLASLGQASPADRGWLRLQGPPASADEFAFRLRNSGHDPWALQAMLDGLDEEIFCDMDGLVQQSLVGGLHTTWQNTPALLRTGAMAQPVAAVLLRLQDWAFARQVLDDAQTGEGEAAAALELLRAHVEAATGHSLSALARVQRLLREAPGAPHVQAMHDALARRAQLWRQSSWYLPDDMRQGPCSLELLDELHFADFLWQYRDPLIAHWAGLPPLQTGQELGEYLESFVPDGGAEFAIVHRDHGLVGGAGVRCHEDMAHIHFWIGADHQGKGLCQSAVSLLLHLAGQAGIRHCFASVLAGNARSQRVLVRTGFVHVASGRGSDEGLDFMCLADARASPLLPALALQRLGRLFSALGHPLDATSAPQAAPSRFHSATQPI